MEDAHVAAGLEQYYGSPFPGVVMGPMLRDKCLKGLKSCSVLIH